MRRKISKIIFLITMAAIMMTGCGDKKDEKSTTMTDADVEAFEDEENYDTGDASLDNPRNQNEIGEKELLVISFGTSFNDNRVKTIGAIEADMETVFGDEYSIRRGFTSQIIIDHIKRRDGEVIDNVGEALDRAVENGVKELVIQPTHLMDGLEYNDIVTEVSQYADAFDSIKIGAPLLTSDEDFKIVAEAIVADTASYDDGETAICFMGHGTEADSNMVYEKMQETLIAGGHTNYYIGTVEAAPTLEDVIAKVAEGNYKKVVIQPLMIVAGDHANNDMASDEEDSWKSAFESEGYEVTCIVKGLGEIKEIRNLIIAHTTEVIIK